MKPRRLHSDTILSMVTTSSGTRRILAAPALLALSAPECQESADILTQVNADLRVQVRERAQLRSHAAHERRSRHGVPGVRGPGRACFPPDRDPFQGVRLLLH